MLKIHQPKRIASDSAPHYLGLMARLFGFSLLAFFCLRLIMMALHASYFENTSVYQILYALIYGVRFDSAVVVILGSVIWLCLMIPIAIFQHPRWRQFLAFVYLLILCVTLILSFGDLYYFGEVNRHTGRELLNLGNDVDTLIEVALKGAPLYTLFTTLLLALFVLMWWRVVILYAGQKPRIPQGIIRKLITAFLVLVLAVFLGRGMVLKSRPIGIVDAFSLPSEEAANLALGSVFVLMKEASRPEKKPLNMMTQEQFERFDQSYLSQQANSLKEPLVSSLFSWHRTKYKTDPISIKPKNVVLILLESWSYQFIDELAHGDYGATPFMDGLVKKSQVWERCYAAGQRSIYGLQAMLSSVPVLDNYPSLGFGLEVNKMSEVGSLAKQQGYNTLFIQTSERRSFHVNGIASRLGFDDYYGKEDIPVIKDYPQETPHFGWDYDGLMFLHNKIDKGIKAQPDSPFLAMLFTGTTHIPYPNPGSDFHIRKHNPKTQDGYLNTLRYSDWSLQQFMNAAKESSWYQDTVFIFLADHTLRASDKELDNQFHIPLIVFAPDGSLPAKRYTNIVSQYDVLPTIMDLIQSPVSISTFGRSLFDDTNNRLDYALVAKGSVYGIVHQQGWATFSGQKNINARTSKGFDEKQANFLRNHARWRLQHADRALNKNEWLSGKETKPLTD